MGMGMGAGMENYGYLVGELSAVAKRAAGFGARKAAPVPDGAETAAVAPAAVGPVQRQRRRRPKTQMLSLIHIFLGAGEALSVEHRAIRGKVPIHRELLSGQ